MAAHGWWFLKKPSAQPLSRQTIFSPSMSITEAMQVCSMDGDSAARLLEATAKLVGVLVWPVGIGYILVRFGSNIGEFISNLGEMTLKGGGFEASMKRKKDEAGAALVAAAISRPEEATTPANAANAGKEAAQAVADVDARTLRKIEGSQVLWVDDRPDNNNYERHSLEALGVQFVISTSTNDALDKIKTRHFDAVISDMGRPPDARAGYTLLEKLRSSDNHIPFIIYASSRSPEHQVESKQRGAVGCTNDPTELFEMVVSALLNG